MLGGAGLLSLFLPNVGADGCVSGAVAAAADHVGLDQL